ncbi:LysR family transcriptional regulator [Roseomonas sp. E05]|uniref:LysR family transcriptional regulator n=1 Tax=Roseomonas sp. E05 TaxID=3046310 RepID=UPI0024B96973|nr:LysR family transcriptional regulator [Roseomonas sp. E05]MDJ0390120.1 LysR family transcriptional regulator [Roseomonas sp. E05]
MHLDLTDLRLFLAILEEGSITAGAARVNLALAAASTRIRGLEARAGVTLLERGRRGVRPTPAGLALLHHARAVQAQVARLEAELKDHAGGVRGMVRLPANGAACAEFLPEALPAFLAAHPLIDVEPEERPSHAVLDAVTTGAAELGIAAAWALEGRAGLCGAPFRTDRLVLVAPRGHRLASGPALRLAEALSAEFVGLGTGSALQAHLLAQATRAGGQLRLRTHAPGFDAACRMVAAGAGVAILPENAARRHRRILAIRRLAESWAVRRLMLCTRAGATLTPQADRLFQHLAREGQ